MMNGHGETVASLACPTARLTPERQKVAVWRQLNTAHDHFRMKLSRAIDSAGLSLVEFSVLDILEEQGGGTMRMQDVSTAAGLSTSATTRLVNRLEQRDLLVRILCASDRRGIYTELTASGRDLVHRVRPVHDEAVVRTLNEPGVLRALAFLATNPDISNGPGSDA